MIHKGSSDFFFFSSRKSTYNLSLYFLNITLEYICYCQETIYKDLKFKTSYVIKDPESMLLSVVQFLTVSREDNHVSWVLLTYVVKHQVDM